MLHVKLYVHSLVDKFEAILPKMHGATIRFITEAVFTAVPAPDDGCQQPKHVDLPTKSIIN